MRIEPSAVYSRYQAYGKSAGKVELPVQTKESGFAAKTDIVSISGAARESSVARLSQNVTTEVEANGSATRLQALRERVQSNEYYVPSQQIAGAMLGLRG